jgi:hypothetical protein
MTLLPELVGESPGILAIRERIARLVARAGEVRRLPPVLIQGETGTGKGLVARALHRAGPRSAGPFVAQRSIAALSCSSSMFFVFDWANRFASFSKSILERSIMAWPYPFSFSRILKASAATDSSSNRFIARFAFLVVPAGKTLDINYIHNAVKNRSVGVEGFRRNLGVGSWELNLAAFFRDLNTNYWTAAMYSYQPNPSPSSGAAFADALSILSYRYRNNFNSQRSALDLFGNAANKFRTEQIDLYSDGPVMTGTALLPGTPANGDIPTLPWSGSENTNGYVGIQELFDTNKTSRNFVSFRLGAALASNFAYDRNTWARLVSQLGTDSLPANRNKLNLNYDNVDPVTGAIVPARATPARATRQC